jgi:ankyrin repeat protein
MIQDGTVALMSASMEGHVSTVHLLIKNGANIDALATV